MSSDQTPTSQNKLPPRWVFIEDYNKFRDECGQTYESMSLKEKVESLEAEASFINKNKEKELTQANFFQYLFEIDFDLKKEQADEEGLVQRHFAAMMTLYLQSRANNGHSISILNQMSPSTLHQNVLRASQIMKELLEENSSLQNIATVTRMAHKLVLLNADWNQELPLFINELLKAGAQQVYHFISVYKNLCSKGPVSEEELAKEFYPSLQFFVNSWIPVWDDIFRLQKQQLGLDELWLFNQDPSVLEGFASITQQCLGFISQNDQQIQESIYSNSGIKQFDDLLNLCKASLIKFLKRIFKPLSNSQNKQNELCLKFQQFLLQTVLTGVVQSLYKYCTAESYDYSVNIPGDSALGIAIIRSLKLLNMICQCQPYWQFFSECRQPLIVDIILPFMTSNAEELKQFEIDPVGYQKYYQDICDKQRSKTIKAKCATLLESLCDNVDGYTTYVGTLTAVLIDYHLSEAPPQKIDTHYSVLKAIQNNHFFTKVPRNIQAETCILITSQMSYLLQTRKDLMDQLQIVWKNNQKKFENPSSIDPLVLARLGQQLSYYAEIFENNMQNTIVIESLVSAIAKSLENAQQRIYSITSLKDLLEVEGLNHIFKACLPDLCKQLTKLVPDIQQIEFFDLISYLFDSEYRILVGKVNATELFVALSKKYLTFNSDAEQLYSQCFGSMMAIASSKKKSLVEWTVVEEQFKVLIDFCIQHEQFKNVLQIGIATLETKADSEIHSKVLKALHKIILEEEREPVLEFLNDLILKDEYRDIISSPEAFKNITQTIIHYLDQDQDAAEYEALLIPRALIQAMGTSIKLEELISIFNIFFKYLEKGEFFLIQQAGGMAGIPLSGFMADCEKTFLVLERRNKFEETMKFILGDLLIYAANEQDAKFFVLGMCSILQQSTINERLKPYLPQIFDALATILEFLTTLQDKNPENEYDSDNDFLHENDINIEFCINKIQELQQDKPAGSVCLGINPSQAVDEFLNAECSMNTSQLKRATDGIDEFKEFKSTILNFKQAQGETLKEVGNKLSDAKKNTIRQLILNQRVAQGEQGKLTKARKILKAKRRFT